MIHSDNGPQFISKDFKKFCRDYGIQHTTSSPYYPKSNGLAEKTVQTLKRLLTKAKREGRDPYLSILDYRNTPIIGSASPAQLLFGRRTRTTIPTSKKLLHPEVQDPVDIKNQLKETQLTQQMYYDRQARPLPELAEGEVVRIKDKHRSGSKQGVIVSPRSYLVEDNLGNVYRRNRQQLVATHEKMASFRHGYWDGHNTDDINEPSLGNDVPVPSEGKVPITPARCPATSVHNIPDKSSIGRTSEKRGSTVPKSEGEVRRSRGRIVRNPVKLDL